LPIHYACSKKAPLSVITYLHDTFPFGIKIKDKSGNLPLHHACKFGAPIETIFFLYGCYQEGKVIRNNSGETPIALIQKSKITHDVKNDIIDILNENEYEFHIKRPTIERSELLEPHTPVATVELVQSDELLEACPLPNTLSDPYSRSV